VKIFFKVVQCDGDVSSTFLQLNVRVAGQEKVKVKVIDGAAVQREVVESEGAALCRLWKGKEVIISLVVSRYFISCGKYIR